MKKSLLQAVTLAELRRFIGNSRTIRRFADRHDLVYFGTVNRDDEARLVKGHTLSRTQRDEHYCVGTVLGRDMIFLQRSDILSTPSQKHKERYMWNILAIDLAEQQTLPHTYLEGRNRHGQAFYDMFAIKHRELTAIPDHMLTGYDPLFIERYVCRTPIAQALDFPSVVTPLTAATVAHHFSLFDYELHEDTLYVYYLSRQPSTDKLDLMVKCGVWLADELDKQLEAN